MAEIEIVEMAPRDGLQNEARPIPTHDKIALIDALGACGFRRIEATAFVSPKWVPQMADAAQVMAGITRPKGVSYIALAPNLRGYEAARAARVDTVAIFASASDGFSRANLNKSVDESLDAFQAVAEAAQADAVGLRGYVSCVTDCPYDGPTPPAAVAAVVRCLLAMGCAEVSLGDTIGAGTPQTVAAMLEAVLAVAPPERLAGHFHDTGGRALDNIDVSISAGLRVFDASVGGLGGCPYAKGATGNVATEAVVTHLQNQGHSCGLAAEPLATARALALSLKGTS
ncbi:MAG: hydroxymethylglutaryl-CoA lyase [Pseudomonadota bacterium]